MDIAARWMTIGFAALALAACGELPQDGPKPFAGKDEVRSHAGAPFNGDRAMYERALAERADTQNEYLEPGAAQAPRATAQAAAAPSTVQ